jgi:hypothetical protein
LEAAFPPTEGLQPTAPPVERTCDELTQLARTDDEDSMPRLDRDLLLNLQSGGQGFGKRGHIVGHVLGNHVEIFTG